MHISIHTWLPVFHIIQVYFTSYNRLFYKSGVWLRPFWSEQYCTRKFVVLREFSVNAFGRLTLSYKLHSLGQSGFLINWISWGVFTDLITQLNDIHSTFYWCHRIWHTKHTHEHINTSLENTDTLYSVHRLCPHTLFYLLQTTVL